MRAYVTGGASNDAQTSAMRARYGPTPRRVASSRLAAHERREGFAQHAPPVAAISGLGSDEGRRRLRFSAGAAATQVATLMAAGGATVPVVLTGTRETARARTVAPLRYLEVAPDVSILRQAQTATSLRDAFASPTEATDNVAWSLLKNPALTSSMNTWPPLAGCLLTGRRKGDRH
jgi:hypothetical protein